MSEGGGEGGGKKFLSRPLPAAIPRPSLCMHEFKMVNINYVEHINLIKITPSEQLTIEAGMHIRANSCAKLNEKIKQSGVRCYISLDCEQRVQLPQRINFASCRMPSTHLLADAVTFYLQSSPKDLGTLK